MSGCAFLSSFFHLFFAESAEIARTAPHHVILISSFAGVSVRFHDGPAIVFLLFHLFSRLFFFPRSRCTGFGAFSSHAYSRDYRRCVISARFRAGYSHEADFRGRSRSVLGRAISPLVRHASANYVKDFSSFFFVSLKSRSGNSFSCESLLCRAARLSPLRREPFTFLIA